MVNGLHLYSAFIQSAVQFMPLIHPFTQTFTHQRRLAAMQGTNQLVRSNQGLGVLLRDTSTRPGWDRTGNPPTARRQLYLLSHIAPSKSTVTAGGFYHQFNAFDQCRLNIRRASQAHGVRYRRALCWILMKSWMFPLCSEHCSSSDCGNVCQSGSRCYPDLWHYPTLPEPWKEDSGVGERPPLFVSPLSRHCLCFRNERRKVKKCINENRIPRWIIRKTHHILKQPVQICIAHEEVSAQDPWSYRLNIVLNQTPAQAVGAETQ